jgi:TatD DNase family protein
MVETDCPWLTPVPFRGKQNRPSYVKYILEGISSLLGIDNEKLEIIIDNNTKEFFNFNETS